MGALAAALAKVSVKVTKVGKVEGDASVAVVRGTKRFLFDLSAELDYEVVGFIAAATVGDCGIEGVGVFCFRELKIIF
jgi:hypothetical protein